MFIALGVRHLEEVTMNDKSKKIVKFTVDKSKLLTVAGPVVTWQDNSCTKI